MDCLCERAAKTMKYKMHDEIMISAYRSSSYRGSAKHLVRLLLTEPALSIAQLK